MKKSIKVIIAITMAVAMVIGLCAVSYAATSFPIIPYQSSGNHTDIYNSGIELGSANGDPVHIVVNYNDIEIFLFWDSTVGHPRAVTAVHSTGALIRWCRQSQSNPDSYNVSAFETTDTITPGLGLYSVSFTQIGTNSGNLPVYSTSDGVSAVYAYINGGGVVSDSLDVVVPNGYALYVSIPAETVTIQLTATMPYNSELFGNPWPNIFSYINNVISLPTVGDTVLVGTGWSGIIWEKSPTGTSNLFGQTRSAVYSEYPTSGGWYVVYNPAVSWDSNLAEISNPSILAHFSKAIEYRLYPTTDGVISGVQSMTLGNPWESSAEDDWVVTPPSGQDIIPPSGGNNALPDDTGVEGILNRLVEMIRSIFEVAWRPIQEILQSVGGFFEKLADLWSWLPTEVSSLLIAGVTVIVAVGVLKSFL